MLLAAVAAALAGCGGSSSQPSGQDPQKLLEQTFGDAQRPVSSGRLKVDVRVRAAGIDGVPSPLRLTLSGPFQGVSGGGTPRFAFDLRLATADGSATIGVISTGKRGWVRLGQRAYTLSAGQFAQLGGSTAPADAGGGVSLAALGVDPQSWLRATREVGVETLDGVKVVHLRSGVDEAKLLADVARVLKRAGGLGAVAGVGSLSTLDTQAAARALKGVTVDVWTGERDHILRRLRVLARVDTAAQRGGTIVLDLTLAGIGEKQAIGPPANPRPLSELASALSELARSGTPSSNTTPGYEACVTDAGGDVAKTQACSRLLR
ncbi:unannotated protein [freshwater metagenome]|uniref:Unannotated protein n=1 Tax=freshwater metagenome TaxID=449393 RepID=A0A6J7CUP7_9ZZZZ